MNTNFRKLKMLELAMADDSLKDDANDATSILEEFDDVSTCVSVYDGNQHCLLNILRQILSDQAIFKLAL